MNKSSKTSKKSILHGIKIPEINKMPEDIKTKINPDGGAIFEIEPDRIMPVFMFGVDIKINRGKFNGSINLAIVVSHNKKENNLSIKSRIKNNATQEKIIANCKETFPLQEIEKAKTEAMKFFDGCKNKESKIENPWHINFDINESLKSTIEKLNKSNQFYISIEDQNKD